MARQRDYTSVFKRAEAGIASGDWLKAIDSATQLLLDPNNPPEDVKRVYSIVERVAPHSEFMMFRLAGLKLHGTGTRRDLKGATEIYRNLSKSDQLLVARCAHGVLGNIVAGDYGGKGDLGKALSHFEQAARLGSHSCALNAALAHRYGMGTPVDLESAERLFWQSYKGTVGTDPQTCIELAALLVDKGLNDDAYEILSGCTNPTDELDHFLDAFHGGGFWDTPQEFVDAFNRRSAQRFAMLDVIARSSAIDRMLRLNMGFSVSRLCAFAEGFLGWRLDGCDVLACQFGDRVADVVTEDDKRYPVFAVRLPMDTSDPLIVRLKASIAKRHKDAVILPSMLLNGHYEDQEGEWFGYGLLLKDGKWSEFALMPSANGFDGILAEFGALERDPAAYLASKSVARLPGIVSNWMDSGAQFSDLQRAAEHCLKTPASGAQP